MAWQRGDPAGLSGAVPLDADSGWRAPPMKLTPKQARAMLSRAASRNLTKPDTAVIAKRPVSVEFDTAVIAKRPVSVELTT